MTSYIKKASASGELCHLRGSVSELFTNKTCHRILMSKFTWQSVGLFHVLY